MITDLQQLHDFLRNEGERIQREISNYLQLNQTAMGSTKMIADNIVLWKETATRERFAGAQPALPSIELEAKLRSQS